MFHSEKIPRWMTAGLMVFVACGGDAAANEQDAEARDLTVPEVEPIAAIDDNPIEEDEVTPPPPPPRERTRVRDPEPVETEDSEPEPAPPTLLGGTTFFVYAADTINSRHNEVGEAVTATIAEPIHDESGEEVIPAGAQFLGVISELAPAETPGGDGKLGIFFNRVEFGGNSYALNAVVDTAETRMQGRGVTAGDAAKVGAGTAVGAIAGRVLGGNSRGTVIGAAVGTAAGVGVAAATRDVDIFLDAGAGITLVLLGDFVVTEGF